MVKFTPVNVGIKMHGDNPPRTGNGAYHFAGFALDLTRGALRSNGCDIDLRPKSFAVLRVLVENAERLLSKDELTQAVWRNVAVTDDSLKRCISELRLALDDRAQRLIKTVPRRGYMLAAPATFRCATSGHGASGGVKRAEDTAAQSSRIADRPSIAVLPFANLSGEPDQEYFADGISEDLTTSLSKFSELFVIARNSAFRFKGKPIDVRAIGSELATRYILEGSTRRYGDRVRITAQLIDCSTGNHLWAEFYDRQLDEIFAVQDDVTRAIVITLVAHIRHFEIGKVRRRRTESMEAYDLCLRGNAVMNDLDPEHRGEYLLEARALYEGSLSMDPQYVPAIVGLADSHIRAWLESGMCDAIAHEFQNQETIGQALSFAQRAVELDSSHADAHAMLGWVLHWLHRRPESMIEFDRALRLNPNFSARSFRYGIALILNGRTQEGVAYLQTYMKHDPFYSGYFESCLGCGYFFLGRYEDALERLRIAVRRIPKFRTVCIWHAAAAAQAGHQEEAARSLLQAKRVEPDLTISKWLKFIGLARDEDRTLAANALRKAGLEDQ